MLRCSGEMGLKGVQVKAQAQFGPNSPTAILTVRATTTVLKTKAVRLCTVEVRRMPRSAICTSAVWDATPMISEKCRKSQ